MEGRPRTVRIVAGAVLGIAWWVTPALASSVTAAAPWPGLGSEAGGALGSGGARWPTTARSDGQAAAARPTRSAGEAADPATAATEAVDRFVAAFNARGPSPLVTFDPEGGFRSADPSADSALAAAFGPRAQALAWVLGTDRFEPIDWLPEPWQYHGFETGVTLRPGHHLRLTVLARVASGTFVTQRERFSWEGPDGARGSRTGSVTYQVRAGRIHRVWHAPAEPDADQVPAVTDPAYAAGEGPTLRMDVWHHNTATPEGTYWNLAELLRRDGWRVRSWEAPFTRAGLDSVAVLLVANAGPDPAGGEGGGVEASVDPDVRAGGAPGPGSHDPSDTEPRSAFTPEEVEAVRDWVAGGGALLLVADHEPYAGAAAALARAFGADFRNGSVRDTARGGSGNIPFRRRDGTLRSHPVTDGRRTGERVDSVLTLLGQGFLAEDPALEPLLVLPETAVFQHGGPDGAPGPGGPVAAGGWLQGAARRFGRGRVALFGEAWVFRDLSLAGNARLARNVMRWLAEGR